MPHPGIDAILAAKLAAGREVFHRQLFDALLHSPWDRADLDEQALAAPDLLPLLARWVAEAPVRDELGIVRVLAARHPLRMLVEAAGMPFAAFVAKVLALDAGALAGPGRLPDWKQAKLAALADPALLSPDALRAWDASAPMLARLAAICVLDSRPLKSERAAAVAAIGRWLTTVDPVPMPLFFLEQLRYSAFHVSYLADAQRHDFKRAIVRQAAFIAGAPLLAGTAAARAAGPLRLTIVAEMVYPRHAMFRCYAELLAGLMARHEVTLVAEEPSRCPEHAQFSHRQVYFPERERDVARLAATVASTRPDIILYPSVGMTYWTFVLSLLRLAPLQLMSMGHPAPACSDVIDGMLVYGGLALAPDPHCPPLLPYDVQPVPAPPPGGWGQAVAAPAPAPGQDLVVCINAAAMKLSPPFIEALREVVREAPPGTRLQFLPGISGASFVTLRRALLALFPDAIVEPAGAYRDYMDQLARSSLVLQSFPFGGTNTTMDALALGIPVVCLDSGELAAAADPAILRAAGLAQACVSTPDQFVALALELLRSPERRAALRAGAGAALARGAQWRPAGERTLADAVSAAWEARSGE